MIVDIHKDLKKVIAEENLTEQTLTRLVEQIFTDCSFLNLQPFGKRGFSGAILSVAQGTKITGHKTIVCILRISLKEAIKREFENYKNYVEGCLDHSCVPVIYGNNSKYEGDCIQ